MRKLIVYSFTIFIVVACTMGCTQEAAIRSEVEGKRISLIALVVKPKEFDNVRTTVRGYLRVETNGVALYVSLEDSNHETHISAIWLGLFKDIQTFTKEELQAMNNKYVGVTGTIEADSYGPEKDYNCEIRIIENIKPVDIV